jgi:DnaJ-class molecular chaperone
MTPYQVLGLTENAALAMVKLAYRKLAQQLHPDKNKSWDAEERFKTVKEAYEAIISGSYKEPLPTFKTPQYKPPPSAGIQRVTIKASFKNSFMGDVMQVPGTPFIAKVPYGCRPGTIQHTQLATMTGIVSQDNFIIQWDIYDPNGFYTVAQVGRENMLACTLNVTAAQILAGSEVSLPNINSQASNFIVKLECSPTMTFKVPYAGLQHEGHRGRDELILTLNPSFTALENERYDIMLDMKNKLEQAMKNYNTKVFK